MFEVTVERIFSAAHALRLPDGTMEPIHGHDWGVEVTVGADKLDAMDTVMDFHVLEASLDGLLATVNNRHLNEVAPFADEEGGLAINPSAERVVQWIGDAIAADLPEGVRLLHVRISEAPGCRALYRPAR